MVNQLKHKVPFKEATSVFADLQALEGPDVKHSQIEDRRFIDGISKVDGQICPSNEGACSSAAGRPPRHEKTPRGSLRTRGYLLHQAHRAKALLHHSLYRIESRYLLRERFPCWVKEAELLELRFHQRDLVVRYLHCTDILWVIHGIGEEREHVVAKGADSAGNDALLIGVVGRIDVLGNSSRDQTNVVGVILEESKLSGLRWNRDGRDSRLYLKAATGEHL